MYRARLKGGPQVVWMLQAKQPIEPILFHMIINFSPSYWEANSYYPRGPILGKRKSPNSKIGWERGFPVPGAFKPDHLQPIKPLLFQNFYNFFTFILGGQFLLPQRANIGKREFTQLQNWMRQRGLTARAIQSGPFASLQATFVLKIFQLFHFHTGRPILITPEG